MAGGRENILHRVVVRTEALKSGEQERTLFCYSSHVTFGKSFDSKTQFLHW